MGRGQQVRTPLTGEHCRPNSVTRYVTHLADTLPRVEPQRRADSVRFVERVSESASQLGEGRRRRSESSAFSTASACFKVKTRSPYKPSNVPLTVSPARARSRRGFGFFSLVTFVGAFGLPHGVASNSAVIHFSRSLGRFLLSTWTRFTAQPGDSAVEDFKVFPPPQYVESSACLSKCCFLSEN